MMGLLGKGGGFGSRYGSQAAAKGASWAIVGLWVGFLLSLPYVLVFSAMAFSSSIGIAIAGMGLVWSVGIPVALVKLDTKFRSIFVDRDWRQNA